ncbi:MAG: hypothetical protein E6G34_05860 [Actinobacteria bacterium]|nr:MAG: hypothetical protein E6G34_05860 [Actinomycetota bacterium]
MRAHYDMELTVLVDVVQGIEHRQVGTHESPLVVPTLVWLEHADGPPLALAKLLDAAPTFIDEVGLGVEDRELTGELDLSGDRPATVVPDMKLPGEMVEGGAKVKKDLSHSQRPVGFNSGQLAQVEAVLKSAPVYLGPNGPCMAWRPELPDLTLKYSKLALCPRKLRDWPFEAPAHMPSLFTPE